MYSKSLIKSFVETNGAINASCDSEHCHTENGKFFSYDTIIAEWENGTLKVNYHKYTHTTRVHQNALINWAKMLNKAVITFDRNLPLGTHSFSE